MDSHFIDDYTVWTFSLLKTELLPVLAYIYFIYALLEIIFIGNHTISSFSHKFTKKHFYSWCKVNIYAFKYFFLSTNGFMFFLYIKNPLQLRFINKQKMLLQNVSTYQYPSSLQITLDSSGPNLSSQIVFHTLFTLTKTVPVVTFWDNFNWSESAI